MSNRENPPKTPKLPPTQSRATDSAFDVWLNRGLHQLFDEIANEPIPEELLRVIREDREK